MNYDGVAEIEQGFIESWEKDFWVWKAIAKR